MICTLVVYNATGLLLFQAFQWTELEKTYFEGFTYTCVCIHTCTHTSLVIYVCIHLTLEQHRDLGTDSPAQLKICV